MCFFTPSLTRTRPRTIICGCLPILLLRIVWSRSIGRVYACLSTNLQEPIPDQQAHIHTDIHKVATAKVKKSTIKQEWRCVQLHFALDSSPSLLCSSNQQPASIRPHATCR
ncbi:hypothetical protein F5H01DRAFT_350411 [Linnemannia elongata]|nr:hypothetical protein F5H01DRAFT_350411 [Linnemannia elongata]